MNKFMGLRKSFEFRIFLFSSVFIPAFLLTTCSYFKMPKDSELEKIFVENRSDFEMLVQMSSEDQQVPRIAYDFTWVEGIKNIGETGKDRPIGFSEERWEAYKKLFREINLDSGIQRSKDKNEVWFLAYTSGLAVSGLTKGYIYSEDGIKCPKAELDDLEKLPADKFLCKKIDENWYIFLER